LVKGLVSTSRRLFRIVAIARFYLLCIVAYFVLAILVVVIIVLFNSFVAIIPASATIVVYLLALAVFSSPLPSFSWCWSMVGLRIHYCHFYRRTFHRFYRYHWRHLHLDLAVDGK
jgi:hypothetical protein